VVVDPDDDGLIFCEVGHAGAGAERLPKGRVELAEK